METIISFVLRAGWRNPALVFCHPNSIFSKFYLFFSLCTSEPSIRQTAFPPGNGVLTQTKMTFLWSGPLPLKDQKIQDHFRQCLPQEKQKMLGFTYQLQMSLMVPFKVDERLAKKKGGVHSESLSKPSYFYAGQSIRRRPQAFLTQLSPDFNCGHTSPIRSHQLLPSTEPVKKVPLGRNGLPSLLNKFSLVIPQFLERIFSCLFH